MNMSRVTSLAIGWSTRRRRT